MQQEPSSSRNAECGMRWRHGRVGCLLDGSGVSREAPAPFCEGPGVRFPRSTHHETCNTLKNQGDSLEHNDGHGKQHLSSLS